MKIMNKGFLDQEFFFLKSHAFIGDIGEGRWGEEGGVLADPMH